MGKVEKTRFQRNWTTFVNPLFTLLGKAQPKWWYETHLVGFDPKVVFSFRPDGESRDNPFWTQLDDLRQPAFCPAWKSPAKMVVWNPSRRIRFQGCFFVSPRWGKSRKRPFNAIGRPSSTGFLRALEKPSQNSGMKPISWNSIPRVFFRFAPMGNGEKARFERNWTTFVHPAFCAAWKSPAKMVVWNPPRDIRSQGCFFVSPRWGKSKKLVYIAIGRPSSTRLFVLLGEAHSKWCYETDFVEFYPKGVFSFPPDGESRKNAF